MEKSPHAIRLLPGGMISVSHTVTGTYRSTIAALPYGIAYPDQLYYLCIRKPDTNLIETMNIETERLILRPWRLSDAEDLYRYASDDRVGPVAGWPPHTSVEQSREVIRDIFSQEGVFAVTLKGDDTAVGCIGLIRGAASNFPITDLEGEISYWMGVPFWGQGYITEAIRAVIDYGFRTLGLHTLWCGYFEGNERSRRAQERCGFRHHHTEPPAYFPLIGETRVEHVSILSQRTRQNDPREPDRMTP